MLALDRGQGRLFILGSGPYHTEIATHLGLRFPNSFVILTEHYLRNMWLLTRVRRPSWPACLS